MAFWPEWVLERCVRIVELQRAGHTLKSAVTAIEMEHVDRAIDYAEKRTSFEAELEKKHLKVSNGSEVSLLHVFQLMLLREADKFVLDRELRQKLYERIKKEKVIDSATLLIDNGYNPILVFDGEDVSVTADFMVSQQLSYNAETARARFVIPLLPPLRRAFRELAIDFNARPSWYPAPIVRVRQGDTLMQYEIYPAAADQFEVIHSTGQVLDSELNTRRGFDSEESNAFVRRLFEEAEREEKD